MNKVLFSRLPDGRISSVMKTAGLSGLSLSHRIGAMWNGIFYGLMFCLLGTSCATYKQNIMFKVPEGQVMARQMSAAEQNYVIQKNDYLTLEVYTNEGERLIDPDRQLAEGKAAQTAAGPEKASYLVDEKGMAKFPMIGELKLEGLTIREGEAILQTRFAEYYKQPFVVLRYQNKRVIVLGAPGGQVIPLTNENMRLTEVLALARGVGNDAKAHNIRVLRGNEVFVVDFSTFEGYTKNNMIMAPGDVVYVEPIRKPFAEAVRDYGPIMTIVTSLITLTVVIVGL